ncbi:FadR/GntR family transcriptional regulator [Falsirhodobacter sp. 20TX0035]|uniref:FadR/GntR family transcriptional regulator n=1 Tax=Falsirhodobacter sp. 20TX0035 TaxID=3022019 RepID=UPI00232B704D|nr:FadR/GntR family transcriptional regulator [Falsirhodobacter sp. 20TX0035]MDB6452972.1 FadR/GntR family transcriptional regulator [Falsirhodobacter sp. 20TX0035]
MTDIDDWLTAPAPFHRKNAAELVFEELRDAILAGRFPVGSRLPSETRLALKYRVSRPIVREALRSLQTLGLTQTRTGSGTYVLAPPDRSYGRYSARDLAEARPCVEVPAAGLAALRRTGDQLAGLLALCERMEREEDHDLWVRLDSDFHALIAESSQNAVFAGVVADARESLMRQSSLLNVMEARRDASNIEHRVIAEAIRDERREAAETAMRDHLDKVGQVVARLGTGALREG